MNPGILMNVHCVCLNGPQNFIVLWNHPLFWFGFHFLFLLAHYMNCKPTLFSIVAVVGKPLRVDHAIVTLNQPLVARILVKCDVAKTLSKRVWIGEGEQGFWQDCL